eukprot:7300314-Alexandrium_andersonii.AAC.1
MANAFGSTSWEALDLANDRILEDDCKAIGRQRYEWACVVLPTPSGSVCLKNTLGAFMGDPYVVRSFTEAFAPPIREWQLAQRQIDSD